MNVREFTESDVSRVHEILDGKPWFHEFPDMRKDRFAARVAVTNGNGSAVAFGFCRVIGEAHLVIDHEWSTPKWRWEALQMAHDAARDEAVRRGIIRCVTWIPTEIVKSYGKRLESLGWQKQDRTSFCYEVR